MIKLIVNLIRMHLLEPRRRSGLLDHIVVRWIIPKVQHLDLKLLHYILQRQVTQVIVSSYHDKVHKSSLQ